ncbi:nitroreductase family protein [Streptacidiphilus sp. P02-A3a]|uniref:nitroreductase family protein n=1 Tax=Streptacidiphilus sp. P02-A3a TaxID=2704468 RepID=UPI0015FAA2D0|nr:nitroreductase family protein [Streptacidiphilus sp. P02-A3a]QMU73701.1 nitroreductase [Streptacidiphilus sp. P02-A3a]
MATMPAMRRLSTEPVSDEMLERLVQAAVYGPSGSNAQDYQYVLVTDRQVMAGLAPLWTRCVDAYIASVGRTLAATMDDESYELMRAEIEYQRDHFADTPALVIPCYHLPKVNADLDGLRGVVTQLGTAGLGRLAAHGGRISLLAEASSVYPGTQNLLLAARTLGLGASLTIWHLMLEREWKAALGIPSEVHTFAVIPIGWPLDPFGPVDRRPVAEVLHRDRW